MPVSTEIEQAIGRRRGEFLNSLAGTRPSKTSLDLPVSQMLVARVPPR